MIMKALADKVVLRVETNKIKKIGDKEIHIQTDTKEFTKMYVVDVGPEVKRKMNVGQEVICPAYTTAVCHPEIKDMIIVSEQDIWGVIEGVIC